MADPNIYINHKAANGLKNFFQNSKRSRQYNYLYPTLSKSKTNYGPIDSKGTFLQTNQNKLYDLNDDSAIGMSERQPLIENEIMANTLGSSYDEKNSINHFYPALTFETGNISDFGSSDFAPKHPKMPKFQQYQQSDFRKKMLLEKSKRTTNLQTMMHILKGNIGTGILALPNAFMNAGLYVGLIVLPILCMLCTHCMHILVRANAILSKRLGTGMLEYQEVASHSILIGPQCLHRFSGFIAQLVNTFLLITQLGFCCVYSLFVAENVSQFVSELTPERFHFTPIAFLAFLLPMFILLSFVRSLRHLSLASSMANLLQTLGLMIVLFNLIQDLPSTDTVDAVGSIAKFPLFLGTAIYAFEGIGLILPLQKEMKEPESLGGYFGVLNTSMTLVACLNIAIGFFGYLKFGNEVKGSITLILPPEPLYQSCKMIFAIAIFLSYAIQYYVPFIILWPWFKKRFHLKDGTKKTNLIEYIFRASLVVFTLALAAAVPKLDLFISLVGAVSSSGIALIVPPLIDICVLWNEEKGFWNWTWIYCKNAAIFLLGIAGFTTGTYASIENILIHIND